MRGANGNTLADFPPDQFTIWAICNACGYQVALEREGLPEGLVVQELPRRLRCGSCGGRDCGIRIVYSGAGGFRYGRGADPESVKGEG
jgi:hypothetical protein